MPNKSDHSRFVSWRIFIFPTVLASLVLTMAFYQYYKNIDNELEQRYQHIENAITRTAKVLKILNFTVTANFQNNAKEIHLNHQVKVDSDICHIIPSENQSSSLSFSQNEATLLIDYMVLAKPDFCRNDNPAYRTLLDKLTLAPMLSLLNGLDPFSTGMYFVSTDDFGLVSPKKLGMLIDISMLNGIKTREYWKEAMGGAQQLRLSGPNIDVVTGKRIVTLSMPVYDQQKMIGMNLIDIVLDELIPPITGYKQRRVFIGHPDDDFLDSENPYYIYPMDLGDVKSEQFIYMNWSWKDQLLHFWQEEQKILIALFIIYLISIVALIYWHLSIEKAQYSRLSQLDTMSGLLNRRGFEETYDREEKYQYQALGIFDIDDFKLINDTFGHDIGDTVIIYTANQLLQHSSSRDIIARFGGEEFVVYMTANHQDEFYLAFDNLRQQIQGNAQSVIQHTLTVSVGLSISQVDDHLTLEEQLKIADLNLYKAKKNGKNQVVI